MVNRLINSRRKDAFLVRQEANEMANSRPHPDHISNGEEEDYRYLEGPLKGNLSYIGNFSKGLRHNNFGEVAPDAYRAMVRAMYSADPLLFERTDIMGSLDGLNLINPQSGLAFDLEGADAQAVTMPPAPRIDSAEGAAEMGELYWMALIRDVNFANYSGNGLVGQAVNSLNNDFTKFSGPKNPVTDKVTRPTLFRGFTPGDLAGPYVSQFLLKPIPYGTLMIEQLNNVALAGQDYLTKFSDWRRVQNGHPNSDLDPNGFIDLAENMIPRGQPALCCNRRSVSYAICVTWPRMFILTLFTKPT